MQEEAIIQKLHRFVDEKDELELQYRKVIQEQEEENGLLHAHNQRLEDEWIDCGQQNPTLGNLLEEERWLLEDFRYRKSHMEETVREAFRRDRTRMEDEMDELQRKLRMTEKERSGRHDTRQ